MIHVSALRRAAAGLVLMAAAASAGVAQQATATVDGFRSARFEMTEEQVRQSIASDFKLQPAQITKQLNKVDRTTILSVRVPDLLPESGIAQINYKLGYTSKKLIQVDVIWGTAIDPKSTPQGLGIVIVNLRNYLQERGYDKEKTVVNQATPQANIALLFRAQDEKGRVVAMLGQFKLDPKAEKGKQMLLDQPEAVIMSYVLDPRSPDVFKIEKGKF